MESIREYKTASILTPVYVTVEVIMEVLIPFVMASLIDKGIEAGSMSVIWKYGIILLVLAMIALAFGSMAGHQASIASCGLAQNLRKGYVLSDPELFLFPTLISSRRQVS